MIDGQSAHVKRTILKKSYLLTFEKKCLIKETLMNEKKIWLKSDH